MVMVANEGPGLLTDRALPLAALRGRVNDPRPSALRPQLLVLPALARGLAGGTPDLLLVGSAKAGAVRLGYLGVFGSAGSAVAGLA